MPSRFSFKIGKKKQEKKAPEVAPEPMPTGSESLAVCIRIQVTDLPQASLVLLPSDRRSPRHLYLIEGTFEDINRYSGPTVDWIIRIAHLLCDPLRNGHVYTHPRGTPDLWWDINRDSSWTEVSHGGLLYPGIYEFEPTLPHPITLSKICLRQNRSVTTEGSGPQSSPTTFRQHLNERDGDMCAVTGDLLSLRASHLIPKCLGTEGAKDIVNRFVGAAEVMGIHPRIHKYHASIGILLYIGLDSLVDAFQAGFYHDTNNTYTLHNFCNVPMASVHGTSSATGDSLLHGYSATLQVHAGEHHLPPPGVFNWHYLQCVIKKFGTPEYMTVSDIRFFIHPFRTASDTSESESGDDSSTKPPHPPNPLAHQMESHWALERKKEVLEWASGVPSASGICVQGSTISK
ncbi:hypothetical protein EDB89DRAFT_74370 [Lactarius sanguifluus]|nr:hypothetical protein EDB89DRAFT_74370 [Lactarius sanguifluus]